MTITGLKASLGRRLGIGLSATAALVAALAVAGCDWGKKPADQRSAAGEVLSGSVGDAMIRYDQLKSQPPLAPEHPAATGNPTSADESDTPSGDSSGADSATQVQTAEAASAQ